MSDLRIWFWSVRNWAKGYKFGPVQRFRCCDHTTPFHYRACLAIADTRRTEEE